MDPSSRLGAILVIFGFLSTLILFDLQVGFLTLLVRVLTLAVASVPLPPGGFLLGFLSSLPGLRPPDYD